MIIDEQRQTIYRSIGITDELIAHYDSINPEMGIWMYEVLPMEQWLYTNRNVIMHRTDDTIVIYLK